MDRKWLIVVDVQNGFVNRRSDHVVEPIAEFMRKWNESGGSIIATRFHNPPGSQWERLIHWQRLRDSPEVDLHPSITSALSGSESNLVIDKESYSSLTPEVLDAIDGSTLIHVCGIATDGCVLKTAVDLFELGRTPIVISDLVASHAGEEVHSSGLQLIGRFIGGDQLRQSSDAIRCLDPDS